MGMSDLAPCPFCGAPAEWDTRRGYRSLSGQLGSAVAVYCTACPADMITCREDRRGEDSDELMAELIGAWNRRAQTAGVPVIEVKG